VPHFDSDGLRIAYEDVGEGPPTVLVHGFAASRESNWKRTGWVDRLTGVGRRVVALDCRGHGESDAPHDPAVYDTANMASDVLRLMDHVGLERADLMGYSMGGMIATRLLLDAPERFRRVVLAGIGGGTIRGRAPDRSGVADALAAAGRTEEASELARGFRAFAESQGADLQALAAVMRAPRKPVDAARLADVKLPVLIVVGERDALVGDPQPLADAIPGAKLVTVPDKDHLTTVPDTRYKEAVLEFLDAAP
jgi:pimeloyl-ACP methyl ester carboxylesterase